MKEKVFIAEFDKKVLREKATIKEPPYVHGSVKYDNAAEAWRTHLTTLKEYPAAWLTVGQDGKEFVEGVDFVIKEKYEPNTNYDSMQNQNRDNPTVGYMAKVALPIPKEKQADVSGTKICPSCKGSGQDTRITAFTGVCGNCNGTGKVAADVSTPETFEDYMRDTRNEFILEVNKQEWNVELRTVAEDLLICFDQMREKLTAMADVSIESLAKEKYPYPENDLYKEGDPDLEEMFWVVDGLRQAFKAGYAANQHHESIEVECTHLPLIDTGVGYYCCPACNQGWTYDGWKNRKTILKAAAAKDGQAERMFSLKEMIGAMIEGEVIGNYNNVIKRKQMRQQYFKEKFNIEL